MLFRSPPLIRNRPATPTVFIVDGHSGIRDSLRFLIRAEGWNVEAYFSAEDFLHTYASSSPGCLILELDLPGMGGLGLQQRLIQMDSSLPAIILTVRGNVANVVKSLHSGAFDHFEKPVEPALLLGRIRDAIQEDARRRETEAVVSPSRPAVSSDHLIDRSLGDAQESDQLSLHIPVPVS